jgi:hypothetical protein
MIQDTDEDKGEKVVAQKKNAIDLLLDKGLGLEVLLFPMNPHLFKSSNALFCAPPSSLSPPNG